MKKNNRFIGNFIKAFFLSLILLPFSLLATGAGVTYHGRLIGPNGEAVTGSNVQFKIQIRTPGNEDCLMYEEVQIKDLSQTNGTFSVTINDGTGSRTDSSGFSIDQIFANHGLFTFAGGKCISGSNYSPNVSDGRKIQVYFNDGTFASGDWEPTPSLPINFIPMSIESIQVGGYKASNLLRVDTSQTAAELSAVQLTDLMALINGTSTKYMNQSTTGSVALPNYTTASPPSAPSAGSIWFDSTSKQIKYNDGTSTQTIGSGGGGSPTGAAGGDLSGSYPNPTLASNSVTATKIANAVITDVHISGSAAIADSKLATITTAGKVSGSAITSGTIAGSTAISTTGNISTSGNITSSGNIQTTGSITSKNLYLYDHAGVGPNSAGFQAPTTVNNNYVLTMPTDLPASNGYALSSDTSGILSWSPLSNSQWTTSGSDIYYNTGNVGIGTTSPGSFSGSGIAAASHAFEVSGNGSASSASYGTLILSNNKSSASATNDYLGLIVFGHKDSSPMNGQFRASIGSNSTGTGGINGFGADLYFSTRPDNVASSPIERMRITSSGNVGVGTTAPVAKLEVAGNIMLSSGSSRSISIPSVTGTNGDQLTINAGSVSGASGNGGSLILNAGSGYTGGGGSLQMNGGSGTAGIGGTGGPVSIIGGQAGAGFAAGNVSLTGGMSNGAGAGSVNVMGGMALNASGGNINIAGGSSLTSGSAGNVYINGGQGIGGGVNGNVILANILGNVGIGVCPRTNDLVFQFKFS